MQLIVQIELCTKFALGFNLNLGNTKKMDEKMPIIDKLKDENEKLDENNDLLKNEINNIKSDIQT